MTTTPDTIDRTRPLANPRRTRLTGTHSGDLDLTVDLRPAPAPGRDEQEPQPR